MPYADSSTIPAWANAAFLYLYNQGLLDMWNGPNLQPWRPVTRAEAAAIIDQINR
ncbi:MAG: S-layer homology domain-containing protein [Syntrophomonadaceae bacterium]